MITLFSQFCGEAGLGRKSHFVKSYLLGILGGKGGDVARFGKSFIS